ncbi:betaine--homocysteine S-methyltransferase 1-like isoform X2 [Ptychodera flava]|uniref:betaine--homocysteine S-methyltransferase 1-like isoform X2 n=1 Tax=Ptychodera flava TaxID=63121 RepID=UPI00396A0CC1
MCPKPPWPKRGDKIGLLERLASGGVVVGDGSYVVSLEKRGYVRAGPWTPEAVVEHPEAITQLSREFVRAGADVVQAFTFYSTDDKLQHSGGSEAGNTTAYVTSEQVNRSACNIARKVADEGNALVCGGISPTPSYQEGRGKEVVQEEFRKQCKIFVEEKVDFLLAEFFGSIEELEWGVEVMKATGMPLAATMRLGPSGDQSDVSIEECAVRMANAGCDLLGVNCLYDPDTCILTMKKMKEALEAEGLKAHLMAQPLGFHTQEVNDNKQGYMALPDWPLAMESRAISRADAHRFAREAYDLGVRYIGGCCGFEPYHIRAIAEELSKERGFRPPGHDKNCLWGDSLQESTAAFDNVIKANREYWEKLKPAAGRADAPALSTIPKDVLQ